MGLEAVTGHELIYGELLIGERGGRSKLLSAYQHMYQAGMFPHRDIVAFFRHRGLHGRGLGWIDVHLLVSAVVGRLELWIADRCLGAVAAELGVAYEVASLAKPNGTKNSPQDANTLGRRFAQGRAASSS
jgi:hypothetical protein